MKLSEFVKNAGSLKKAAPLVGVHWLTLFNYIHGHRRPRGLQAKRLEEMGLTLD